MHASSSSSSSRVMSANATSSTKKKRMLALHGKGGSGAQFGAHLQPLVDATSHVFDWFFCDAPHREVVGYGWWVLEPGTRTYQAKTLPGLEHSIDIIKANGPFEGVFGFSQGAMLAAMLACDADAEAAVTETIVAVGAAYPTCEGARFDALVARGGASVRSLHVIGELDAVNPPEQAKQVADMFGDKSEVYTFRGGHTVPMNPEALQRYVEFLTGSSSA